MNIPRITLLILCSTCSIPLLHGQNNPFADLPVKEEGWKSSDWYGWVHDTHFPWIFTTRHGWQAVGSGEETGFWLWDRDLAWIWTGSGLFPRLFANQRHAWLTFLENRTGTRVFFDNAAETELAYDDLSDSRVPRLNGFSLTHPQIPERDIVSGGPPRDGIPAILEPRFVSQEDADAFMEEDDIVLSVTHNDITRAYPFRILNWHEIVNDQIGDLKFAATYCPLCGTAMVFDRVVNGRTLTFGVSGLLYRDNVLMYDHQTESLWNQLALQAQTGPMFKTPLRWIPGRQLRYKRWKEEFPNAEVLSTETGFSRNYNQDPYTWVPNTDSTLSDVPVRDDLEVKAWVFGVLLKETARAYPLEVLQQTSAVTDSLAGIPLELSYDAEADELTVVRRDTGEIVPTVQSFWFAWQGFYPDTTVFDPDN